MVNLILIFCWGWGCGVLGYGMRHHGVELGMPVYHTMAPFLLVNFLRSHQGAPSHFAPDSPTV